MKKIGTKTLETERLVLRKVNELDYKQAYLNWCSDFEVSKYVTWEKHASELVTKELFDMWSNSYDDETYRWIIELKDNHEVIGTIDVSKKLLSDGTCSLGYCLSKKYWNKGIMTEAVKKVIKYLFEECEAEVVCAEYLENNPASGKVMAKSGMKYEATLRKRILDKDGKRNDLIVYSILRDEYFNKE